MPKYVWPRAAALLSVAILSTALLGGTALADAPDQADGAEVLGNHVFVVVGASLVNPTPETDPNELLYTINDLRLESTPGDPVTWGEWSAATGTSRATTIGGPDGPRTDVRISLTGLIPGGTYSIFWATVGPDSVPPVCSTADRSVPLDAFKADPEAPDRQLVRRRSVR